MARSRTPGPKPKSARLRPGPKRQPFSRSAAPSPPLDDFVQAAAAALALPLKPEWLPVVTANLEVNLRMATLVAEFLLPDETEPAPVFTA